MDTWSYRVRLWRYSTPFGEMHAEIGHASNHSCLPTLQVQIIYTPKYWDQPYTPGKAHHPDCWLYMPKCAYFRYTWIWIHSCWKMLEQWARANTPNELYTYSATLHVSRCDARPSSTDRDLTGVI